LGGRTECDERDSQILRLQLFVMVAQLRDMLAAGQSTQMTQEDQQQRAVRFEQAVQAHHCTIELFEREIRGALSHKERRQ